MAEIKNASYQEVVNVLGQSVIDQLETNTTNTDAQVRAILNPLRTDARLSKCMITTFTYNLLLGMTSETDPSGKTTYYEYDTAGRLKLQRDQEGKLLKVYDYQYKKSITQ